MAKQKREIVAVFSAQNKAKGVMAGFRRDMDKTHKSMISMAKGALAMAGGLYGLKRGFDYVIKAAMKQEDALFLLEAALRAVGEYSVETIKGFEAFAASIQKATIYGDEEVLALMRLMKSLGVTSTGLEQATKMAIGLAAATDRDVKSMSMYIALAQQGEFTMLRRYIPALRSTTDATEQLRIITEFAARGFEIAEAQAETASGSFRQMWNAVSDLAEVMGQPFLDTMAKDAKAATTNIEILTKAIKKHQEAVEKAIKTEGRLKYMPMGIPFYAPQVPKDIFVKPEAPGSVAAGLPEVIRFEEPDWMKATLALDVMTEAQKKAAASMYGMSMKARGLGDELAREKKLTDFAALAKVRYGADVAGAQAAVERFTKILKESEAAKTAAAAAKKQQAAAMNVERILDGMQRELDIVGQVDYSWERSRESADLQAAAIEAAAGNLAEYNRIMAEGMDLFEKYRLAERWAEVADSMERSFANAFEAMAFEGKKFGDVMKTVLREILMDIIRIQFIRPAAESLTGGLGKFFMAGVGALFAGGAGMATAGTVTPQAGAMYARYQHGGVATRPHLAMVGEVPEAIVPLSGGRSIPVEMRGGGDRHRTLEINIKYEGQERPVISEVDQRYMMERTILDITMKAMETDGPYRRSIAQIRR